MPTSLLSNDSSVCLPLNTAPVHFWRKEIPEGLLHNESSVRLLSSEALLRFQLMKLQFVRFGKLVGGAVERLGAGTAYYRRI